MREYGNDTLTEITYLTLLAFYKPNHGYGVMQFLDEHTNGRVKPGAGTLYGAINSLIKKEWIVLCEQQERKKIYVITDLGKQAVKSEIERLKQSYLLGQEVMDGGSDDEDI